MDYERGDKQVMKKKLCIAPFTKGEIGILNLLSDKYEISYLVSPLGIGIDDIDISYLSNESKKGFVGNSDLENSVKNSDIIFVSNANEQLRYYGILALENALIFKKKVICFMKLNEAEKSSYIRRFTELDIDIEFFEAMKINDKEFQNSSYSKIEVPVLFVGETISNCDSFEVFTKLIYEFKASGKNILAFSENTYTNLYNQQSIIFTENNNFERSIINLNAYINKQVIQNHPDVIIIHLPCPMTKFSDNVHYDFGLSAYFISQAITADYLIYCMPLNIISKELIDNMSQSFSSKFGVDISYVHLSNQILDYSYEDTEHNVQVSFDSFGKNSLLAQLLRKDGTSVYNLFDDNDYIKFNNQIEQEMFNLPFGVI